MSMSKKDYEMVAAIVADTLETEPMDSDGMVEEGVKALTRNLAVRFQQDNPRFQKELFLKEAGVL